MARSDQQTAAFPFPSGSCQQLNTVRESRLLLSRLDQWLLREIRNDLGARVLDVGCGYGNLITLLLDRELVIGTDSDPASVALVRHRFREHTNVRAHVFDATPSPGAELIGYGVDPVISLNVLEHIQHDGSRWET